MDLSFEAIGRKMNRTDFKKSLRVEVSTVYPHESFPLCDLLARLWPMQRNSSSWIRLVATVLHNTAAIRHLCVIRTFKRRTEKKNSRSFQRVELSIPLCSKIFDDKMTSKATSTQSSTSWPGVFCFSNGGHKLEKNMAQKIGLLAGVLISNLAYVITIPQTF